MIICLLFLLLIVLPMRLSLHYSAVTARRYAHNYRQRVFTAMIRAPFSVSPKSLQSSSSSSSSNSAVGINRPTVPVTVGQQLELTIHDLTNQGFGVARYENWVVMVPLTLPGEIVQARIVHNYSSYSEAEIVNILQASADRVTPLCKFYEQCGGKSLQH